MCADAIPVISNRPQYGQCTRIVTRPPFTVSGLVVASGCAQIMHAEVVGGRRADSRDSVAQPEDVERVAGGGMEDLRRQ